MGTRLLLVLLLAGCSATVVLPAGQSATVCSPPGMADPSTWKLLDAEPVARKGSKRFDLDLFTALRQRTDQLRQLRPDIRGALPRSSAALLQLREPDAVQLADQTLPRVVRLAERGGTSEQEGREPHRFYQLTPLARGSRAASQFRRCRTLNLNS